MVAGLPFTGAEKTLTQGNASGGVLALETSAMRTGTLFEKQKKRTVETKRHIRILFCRGKGHVNPSVPFRLLRDAVDRQNSSASSSGMEDASHSCLPA